MLVVIGIIAILAAITVPTYFGITSKAAGARLLADSRNVEVAIAMTAAENGDVYPLESTPSDLSADLATLAPNLKATDLDHAIEVAIKNATGVTTVDPAFITEFKQKAFFKLDPVISTNMKAGFKVDDYFVVGPNVSITAPISGAINYTNNLAGTVITNKAVTHKGTLYIGSLQIDAP